MHTKSLPCQSGIFVICVETTKNGLMDSTKFNHQKMAEWKLGFCGTYKIVFLVYKRKVMWNLEQKLFEFLKIVWNPQNDLRIFKGCFCVFTDST